MLNDALFLDTSYIYALFNSRDQWHERALRWEEIIARENSRLLTTEFILAEIADGLSSVKRRTDAVKIIRSLSENLLVEILPASSDLYQKGFELYENRPDKDWGLTDCISFVVMSERQILDALTSDEHFRQAGFRALLLEESENN